MVKFDYDIDWYKKSTLNNSRKFTIDFTDNTTEFHNAKTVEKSELPENMKEEVKEWLYEWENAAEDILNEEGIEDEDDFDVFVAFLNGGK